MEAVLYEYAEDFLSIEIRLWLNCCGIYNSHASYDVADILRNMRC